ncbi:MAG: serine hydrolase, partial [Hyphomonadaceae bacterium]|nr:serine hydrolase [Hyphomonadaceae bacterium]
EQYIAEHVFAPAGMSRSGFLRNDQLPADVARFIGHPRGPNSPAEDVTRFHGVAGSAAGNAYSTVRDMLAFDNALREHRLINAELTAQVLRGQPETGRATSRIGFAGGAPGVNTLLFANGVWTVISLTNREPPAGETIGSTVFPLLAGPRPQ